MNWINADTTLSGETVDLLPMGEQHFAELISLAEDKRIWEFYPHDCINPVRFGELLNQALIEKEKGTQFPFVIFHKKEKKIIGSTRLMEIYPQHKNLEIGWTWLLPEYWATEVNPECKLLLTTFCFETLKAIRVQLKTNENNIRSRKAIEKIGAKYEGILRHHWIADNGTIRNTAYFSIINTEWENAKVKLSTLYKNKKSGI